MADYTVRIVAETKEADDKVKRLDQRISEVARDRKINISIPSLQETIAGVKELGAALNTAYKIARVTPVIGGRIQDVEDLGNIVASTGEKVKKGFDLISSATPGNILGSTFTGAINAADGLTKKTAELGYTIFGITQSVNTLTSAFGSFFDDTVGREIRLQEALLRTKSTLVSTADVAVNGKRIADPFEAIAKLEGPINDTLESIRLRSLDIAGTTSDAIVQVFGVVASQIGNIGGDLKDAEDLAITFSAALGTLGLSDPMYATQEIRSILTGTIDQNSVLARSLGLTNEEVTKAKQSAEGLVGFLQKRLAAFTAGQSLAAKGFAGITSNIAEFQEELKRAFGRGLLQPLLDGLTVLYERLQVVFKTSFGIADALGKTFGAVARGVVGAAAAAPSLQNFTQRRQLKASEGGEQSAVAGFLKVQEAVDKLRPQIAQLSDAVVRAFAQIASGLKNLAEGFAVFKFEQFKIYLSALTNLAQILNSTVIPAFSALLNIYGEILKNPVAQYFSQLGATFDVLNKAGVIPLAKTLFVLKNIIPSVFNTIKQLGDGFKWLSVQIAGLIDYIVTGFAAAIAATSTALASMGRTIVAVATQGIVALVMALKAAVLQLGVFLINISELVLAAGPQFGQVAVAIAGIGKSLLGVEVALDKATLAVAEFGLKTANALDTLQLKTTQVKAGLESFGQNVKEKVGQAGNAVGSSIKSMVGSFLMFSAQLVALQIAITVAFDLWQRWQRSMKEISDQTRAELAVKRLSTAYADVGENATAATKAAKAFEESIITGRIDDLTKSLSEAGEQYRKLQEVEQELANADAGAETFVARAKAFALSFTQSLNPEEIRKRVKSVRDELNRLSEFEERRKGSDKAKEDVQILAKERSAMEKEIKDLRKNLAKEITDFEWSERQKGLQLEQQMREEARRVESAEMERRFQRENSNLGDIGKGIAQIFDEYSKSVFDAQVESEKRQFELVSKREELEKQVSDYRYRLEEQTLKLRERMGQLNKKIVDYEAQERIRASKEVLKYALQAAAIEGEDFVVTPDEKTAFLNAASKQGVSAERALAMLKLGFGRPLGLTSASDPNQVVAAMRENLPEYFSAGAEEFITKLNTVAKNSPAIRQSQGGSFALQTAREELGTGRFFKSSPKAPAKLPTSIDISDVQANVARERAALERNQALLTEFFGQLNKNQTTENLKKFVDSLTNPATWGFANDAIGQLEEQLIALKASTEALKKDGLDPTTKGISSIETAFAIFARTVGSKQDIQKLLGINQDQVGKFTSQFNDVVRKETSDLGSFISYAELDQEFSYLSEQGRDIIRKLFYGLNNALSNLGKQVLGDAKVTTETIINEIAKVTAEARQIEPQLAAAFERLFSSLENMIPQTYSLENANMRSDLIAQRTAMSSIAKLPTTLSPTEREASIQRIMSDSSKFAQALRETNATLDPVNKAIVNFETRLSMAASATADYVAASRGLLEAFMGGAQDMKQAVTDFSTNIARSFTKQFLDIAMAPMQEQVFGQMKRLFGVTSAQEKAQLAMEGLTTSQTDLKGKVEAATAAVRDLTGALKGGPGQGGPDAFWAPNNAPKTGEYVGGPDMQPITAVQGVTAPKSDYEMMSSLIARGSDWQAAVEKELEQSFAGIGESLTHLGTVADTTGKKTGDAANTGEKGFGKFLGAMTGVATGALAITGAIQSMQSSKGGTYETLMGIAGILGGVGAIFGGISGLGKKAAGGPVSANRPYVVGEVGPELFVPGNSGTIIPNNRLAGGSYAASEGYLDQRNTAARTLRNDPIQIDTRVINGVEYVTSDQLRQATSMAERRGAERGQALALGSLQNSVRTRKRVGIG